MRMKKESGIGDQGSGRFLGGIVRGFLAVALCAAGLATNAGESITIRINADEETISAVEYDGEDFANADLDLPAEMKQVELELEADVDLTVPVFKVVTNGVDGVVTSVTTRVATYAIKDGDTLEFFAEEAGEDDPTVTPEQRKAAIIDAIDEPIPGDQDDEERYQKAVAKVENVVGEDADQVPAKDFADYITKNSISSEQIADCDYMIASVKMNTDDLIDEEVDFGFEDVETNGGKVFGAIEIEGETLEEDSVLHGVPAIVATKDGETYDTAVEVDKIEFDYETYQVSFAIVAGAKAYKLRIYNDAGKDYIETEEPFFVPVDVLIPSATDGYSYVVSNGVKELTGVLADGTNTFTVASNDTVKIYFIIAEGYKWDGDVANPKTIPSIKADTVVGDMPKVIAPGRADNPWVVGGDVSQPGTVVEAWTNGAELVIQGEGAIADLSKIPADVKGGITAITIKAGVTGAAPSVFAGLKDFALTLPDGWQGELPKDGVWYGATGVELTKLPLAVKNVVFQQRYPWNGLVDVSCDLTGAGSVTLGAKVLADGETLVAKPTLLDVPTVDLDAAGGVTNGVKFIWNAAADLPAGFKAGVQLKVTVEVQE